MDNTDRERGRKNRHRNTHRKIDSTNKYKRGIEICRQTDKDNCTDRQTDRHTHTHRDQRRNRMMETVEAEG